MEEKQPVKYTVKDSVFTSLFREKKYLLQLYRALHPEDKETTEEDLTNITIENVLLNGQHNDLGFMAGDRLLILTEAQSTWTMNIIVRSLLYLSQTYQEYLDKRNADLYGSVKVKLPKPELYVIYTGEREARPETVTLTEEFFQGEECALEVKVKMLYGDNDWEDSDGNKERDIINQYVAFTKVYNEQRKLYGRTKKAITETIRICKDRNLLKEYLESREKEVRDIMFMLFDEERLREIHDINIAKEAAEKATEKAEKAAIGKMIKNGKLTPEEIADCFTNFSVEDIRQMEKELMQAMKQ